MNTVLEINDIKLIVDFYQEINMLNEDDIKNIMININKSKIIVAHIENNKITSMLTTNLIKNNYYLEHFLYKKYNSEELISLLKYLIQNLIDKADGINILFDNYPYSKETNDILINANFKYNFINFVDEGNNAKIEEFKTTFRINDKSDDVKKYLLDNYQVSINKMDEYLGIKGKNLDNDINLLNTNIVVIRDNLGFVSGVSRFGIVNEYMFVNSIYADNNETYLELLKIIKSLTSRVLQIGVLPYRKDLIELLNHEGYKINQADYIKILTGDVNE